MCDKEISNNIFSRLPIESSGPSAPLALPVPASVSQQGSRRRRLWEMPSQALCPVIGVCLPMPLLRRRLAKVLGGLAMAGDYELHCGAINDCNRRSPIAELLQKELDQRYAPALRLSAQHKSTEALARWWAAAQHGNDVPGALWATLTHARCDTALQELVLRGIHMLQHQVGSAERADLVRIDTLQEENRVLGRELAQAQSRNTRLTQERALEMERLQADNLRMRAELVGRDTLLAGLREEMQALEAAVPGLRHRQEQSEHIRVQLARIHELERSLLIAQQQQQRERRRAEDALQALAAASSVTTLADAEQALPELNERSVLCVGGRQSVVPVYRQLIERTGGRFLHHDGGEEDAVGKLDASLAAADLVICQTGCISHDAYWRVKDHCKRHGKRCVFVDKPSASSLQRALGGLGGPGNEEPALTASRTKP
ncbi:DUF2325 domain-containing protein [Paucibacter sp. JuS9]|uniref:DUF2325 domain-containing protein n=1 Tax=Paucibacter sp. JuS9 TaxID=3228748 RepID=UPI0037571135